jgi:nucleotide-binding universal stress UspA family protein
MKVLIAYDGSQHSDAALRDLQRAGLPSEAECIVLTIADVWLPATSDSDEDELVFAALDQRTHARILELRASAKAALDDAVATAEQAAQIVKSSFPRWKVTSEASADSPAWGIVKRADEWPADLIVMGSHGISGPVRQWIGSVSHRVLTHASCSVRIARITDGAKPSPPRIIIGFDASADAEAAVREVASRSWPEGTEVRLITALDDRIRTAIAARIFHLRPWIQAEQEDDHEAWLSRMAESAAERLANRAKAECVLAEGDPRLVILEAAQNWQADGIFLGATGLRGLRKLLLGSVSNAVTASAPCTVEVVRPRTGRW